MKTYDSDDDKSRIVIGVSNGRMGTLEILVGIDRVSFDKANDGVITLDLRERSGVPIRVHLFAAETPEGLRDKVVEVIEQTSGATVPREAREEFVKAVNEAMPKAAGKPH